LIIRSRENDDAIRVIRRFCQEMADAVIEGKEIAAQDEEGDNETQDEKTVTEDEIKEVVQEVKEEAQEGR